MCRTNVALLLLLVTLAGAPAFAAGIDGQEDYTRGDLGYYYMITGGKFPTGAVPNGDNASGGTMRYLSDSPFWGSPLGTWQKDDWFPENASFALTLKNGGTTVYDNNGIEDGTYGNYYDATGQAVSNSKPGLYRGYSMSNNYDWIYAGYFKIETPTTIDQIIGYYDENAGFNSSSPEIQYDMNIWSAVQDNPDGNPDSWMPTTASFDGDVLSAKTTAGTFSWSYTGVDRIFGDDNGNAHDQIWRLAFTLDTPITLQPGVYFFSHDAEVVPEPSSAALGGMFLLGMAGYAARRRRSRAER